MTDSTDLTWNVSLGDDYDCDTCGWSCNGIEVDREEGEWYAVYRVGCYGGGSAQSKEEAIALVINVAESWRGRSLRDYLYNLAARVFLEEGENGF